MVKGLIVKWSIDHDVKRKEFPKMMGLSQRAFSLREANPMELRLKEVMRLWDGLGISNEEKEAFWREVEKEWAGTR